MKLREYIVKLLIIQAKYGGSLKIIYASDEEGNSFNEIFYNPTVGNFKDGYDFETNPEDKSKINVVCIN